MQIYIHIPFCDLKCNYCRFASIWTLQQKKIDFYIANLIKEIKNSTCKSGILNTIYFWWGTPSVLSKNNLSDIFKILKEKYKFSKNIEISLESTPNNITKNNLDIWQELWINRISMWIQTLNEKSLEKINRWNKWDILEALEIMKNVNNGSNPSPYGYSLWKREMNISIDFIIWLPYVKPWEILENIKFILNKYAPKEVPLGYIKHISVYMLEDYYSADKIIETKYDNITYPDDWWEQGIREEEYLQEYSNIKKYLIENWFNNYEISNYWKPWFECKHNIWYWNHKEILAFWLGAFGLTHPQPLPCKEGNNNEKQLYRYANSDNFKDYYAWKKLFENKLDEEDIFLEKVMFQLRTSWIEEKIYKKLDTKKINYFIENNYLEKKSNKIVLLDKWVLVMDYILKEII